MSKLKQAVMASMEEVAAEIDPGPDDNAEQREYWRRDGALAHALALHKINGGMKPVNQILADAVVILEFLKGKNDE